MRLNKTLVIYSSVHLVTMATGPFINPANLYAYYIRCTSIFIVYNITIHT